MRYNYFIISTKNIYTFVFFYAMDTGWNVTVLLIYNPLVFDCFVKRKRILSQQNVNKPSLTQRRRPKKEKNSSCSFHKTIKCNNNVNDSNDSNKNVTNFF